jgi:hypothetical protein
MSHKNQGYKNYLNKIDRDLQGMAVNTKTKAAGTLVDPSLSKKYYCPVCNVVHVLKDLTGDMKCSCGTVLTPVLKKINMGKVVKLATYSHHMLKDTHYFSLGEMRKVLNEEQELMKVSMLRKYGDLAIGDSVRIGKYTGEKIVGAIEKYGPTKLDESAKNEIGGLSGVISGCNVRKDQYRVTWNKGSDELAGKYNMNGFEFFDLGGDWGSYDLDRIIQMGDVGLPGHVNRDSGMETRGPVSVG